MKKEISRPPELQPEAELRTLAALPEGEINIGDVPEQRDWSGAQKGVFFRPIKKQLTLRLDADLIAWFKDRVPNVGGYQTSINNALREYVMAREHK